MDRRRALRGSPGLLLCLVLGSSAWAGEAERLAAEQAMQTLSSAGQYEQAREAANLLIEYTVDEFGERSPELIDPLISLGDIERHLSHPERAVGAYEKAAELVEAHDGVFSDRLVGVLRSIGRAYQDEAKAEDAAAALQRAKVITHRNYGIMNLQQIPILEELTEVYAGSQDVLSANREQYFALRVSERRYGIDSPEVVPGLYRLANWLGRTRQWSAARALYRRAVSILEAAYGPNDMQLVPALKGIADTYIEEDAFRDEGLESLERAVHVYETAEYPDVADHAQSLLALGDWYMREGEPDDAITCYGRAWQLLSDDGKNVEAAQKVLGRPTRLRNAYRVPALPVETAAADETCQEAPTVELEYTVIEDGSVADAVVVESNASNRIIRQVRQATLQARYRPGFVDGQPEPMRVRLRQIYYCGDNAETIAAKERAHNKEAADAAARPVEQDVTEEAPTATPEAEPAPETP